MPVVVVDHPLVAHRLTTLRDASTVPAMFRQALSELSSMLIYEATRYLPTDTVVVNTPVGPAEVRRIRSSPVLVPVLRAGLGMLSGALHLLPESDTGFVGVKRNEETLEPFEYLNALPQNLQGRQAIVLDPMLATAGSVVHTLELVAGRGAATVTVCCALAAPEGLAALVDAGFGDVSVLTAAIDERLNDIGYIVPGLGDAGDRQFGLF